MPPVVEIILTAQAVVRFTMNERSGKMKMERLCSRCRATISVEKERASTDELYGYSKYDWLCNLRGDLCATCATFELYILSKDPAILQRENINICCHCGNPLLSSAVKSSIDSRFGTGKYDRICKLCDGPLCEGCACIELSIDDEDGKLV